MRKLILPAFALAVVGCTETQIVADAGADAGSDASLMEADDATIEDAFRAPPDAVRSDAGPVRMDPIMPTVRGPCGDFSTTGTVMLQGPGGTSRRANIWVSEAAQTLDGPLVFYWHGAGGSPLEAPGVLGPAQAEILAQGGIVVALTHDPAAGTFPWYLSIGAEETDLPFADEAVACAEQELGIDDHHIHAVGFSAGALHLAQMSLRRASYLASVVTYSGGLVMRMPPTTDAPDARIAAMALFGGPRDVVVVSFANTTQSYVNTLRRNDHFIFTCDHGGGHTVPNAARPYAWQFLQAHPYGRFPAAYASGLPEGFYALARSTDRARYPAAMPITFAVDDVQKAAAPPHTVPFASTVKDVLALGGDAEMRVLPDLATHPLLGAVHRAFAEHRPLVLSPDAVWLTITQGLARHIRLNADSLRHKLVRHAGRKRLEVLWNGSFPEDAANIAVLMDRFRAALAGEIGEGPARFFHADFTTSTEVEKTASDIILLDAYAAFFDYFVGIVCGIPTITLTGTSEDWRSIRARIEVLDELVQGTKIEGWSRGLRIITSKLVEASEGHADRAFFQRIYKPKKAYGSDTITGWVAWFYPYLKRAGRCDFPNGLLAFAPDESLPGEEESAPDAWWTGHGISLTSVPAELSQCLIRVSDDVRDVCFDVTLRGGVACVAVEGDALVPRAAWWCEKGEPSIDEILDEITSKHAFEAPLPPGEFDGGSATILALRARVSSFNVGNGAFAWLPKPIALITQEHTFLSVHARLADGSLVASMRGLHEEVWVKLREASVTMPKDEWEEAKCTLTALEIPVIAKSLAVLLRAALDGRVAELPALSSIFPYLMPHAQNPRLPSTLGRRAIEPDANIPLAPRTTLGLGGSAKYLVEVNAAHELNLALTWAEERALPVFILGGGSNLLVPDAGFDGLVIAMNTRGMATMRSENANGEACMRITVAAGEPWDAFVAHTVAQGWQGLECLSGIPGLVGATPVQNVGAYGQEVSDTIVSVTVFDRTLGHARWLTPEECEFAYRDSALKRAGARYIVQSVTFELRLNAPPALRYAELQKALSHIEKPTLQETRERVIALRKTKSMVYDTSDVNHRSAGSFFTNPIVSLEVAQAVMERAKALGIEAEVPQWKTQDGRIKLAAGWLIERAGVQKGLRIGNVGVSTAHSLALVHHGGGTTSELLALAEEVKRRVREAFGVELLREPVQMG